MGAERLISIFGNKQQQEEAALLIIKDVTQVRGESGMVKTPEMPAADAAESMRRYCHTGVVLPQWSPNGQMVPQGVPGMMPPMMGGMGMPGGSQGPPAAHGKGCGQSGMLGMMPPPSMMPPPGMGMGMMPGMPGLPGAQQRSPSSSSSSSSSSASERVRAQTWKAEKPIDWEEI